ncbi:MAG: hypothetical protein CVV53_02060 [Spirochaetae bacterium HGW-Spirochaetae-9]|nr:MAG: hypothetical protein CVV53_02060 [Spirochaetae bacterium HGW-Spirochaetae-9]
MKRIFAAIVILWFALAGASAQGLPNPPKLSMWNRGVFNLFESGGVTSVGPSWMGDPVKQGPYNSLSLDWSMKDVGWTMTAQWDGDARTYPVYLRDFSGRYSLFNGFLRLTAGKVWSDGGYRFRNFDTTGFSTRIAGGEMGLMAQIQPVGGLSVGTFVPIPVTSQSASATFENMNFGAEWIFDSDVTIKASYRLEPVFDAKYLTSSNREFAIGVAMTMLPDVAFTLGYRFLDDTPEHDLFFDASYRQPALKLKMFADLNIVDAMLYYGGKLNAEYFFADTPFVLGASVSHGNGDAWYNDGTDLNPYVRYEIGGSSVQIGADLLYKTELNYKIQFSYTISF